MGGGQAGAPADNDHVPWSRPPGMATVTSLVTARAGQWGPSEHSMVSARPPPLPPPSNQAHRAHPHPRDVLPFHTQQAGPAGQDPGTGAGLGQDQA